MLRYHFGVRPDQAHPEDVQRDAVCAICGGGDETATDWIACESCSQWVRAGTHLWCHTVTAKAWAASCRGERPQIAVVMRLRICTSCCMMCCHKWWRRHWLLCRGVCCLFRLDPLSGALVFCRCTSPVTSTGGPTWGSSRTTSRATGRRSCVRAAPVQRGRGRMSDGAWWLFLCQLRRLPRASALCRPPPKCSVTFDRAAGFGASPLTECT